VNALLTLPILLPLLGAAVSILGGRSRRVQRTAGLSVLTVNVGLAVALLIEVDRHGPRAIQGGGWSAPMGITLVADRLSALLLVVATTMLLAVLVYAIGQPGAERNHVGFTSVYLVLAAGVSAAFLTGDLFNLFVSIEMMLTASYVLITLGGRLDQVRAGMTYVVISLLASTLFMTVLAFVYAATGTVNMADLSQRIGDLPAGTRAALAIAMLVVFGIKAALVPLHFWLPDSYPTAPSPVTAVFAGLLTKVGIYAIVRTQTLFFSPGDVPTGLLLTLAAVTMVVGMVGAIAEHDVRRILSFSIVGQIGYMVAGIALFDLAGLTAVVLSLVHHIVVKTALFLTGGLVEHHGGSTRLERLGGMAQTAPVLALLFLVPALALCGVPPLSGFAAKYSLLSATAARQEWWTLAVMIGVGVLTLVAMVKIWTEVFWSPPAEGADPSTARTGSSPPALMVGPAAVLVAAVVLIGLFAGPIAGLAERSAVELLDPASYRAVVAGAGGNP
jgi:multicomponent Na+:H+ antiporter subunit D